MKKFTVALILMFAYVSISYAGGYGGRTFQTFRPTSYNQTVAVDPGCPTATFGVSSYVAPPVARFSGWYNTARLGVRYDNASVVRFNSGYNAGVGYNANFAFRQRNFALGYNRGVNPFGFRTPVRSFFFGVGNYPAPARTLLFGGLGGGY